MPDYDVEEIFDQAFFDLFGEWPDSRRNEPNYIHEDRHLDSVTPDELDALLADGWRHFNTRFNRYNLSFHQERMVRVMPLRIRLDEFRPTRSQKRVLRNNRDLTVAFEPAAVAAEVHDLFERHKRRFTHSVPSSIHVFVSNDPARVPAPCMHVAVRRPTGELLAISYFDVGETSTSAIYGCFDPEETRRSLGIFTMLKVIEHSIAAGKSYYYPGYAFDAPSFYDYKKRFGGLETFDWQGNWEPITF